VVKQSILENGYVNPISVDANNVIVTGHTRFKAIMEMTAEERRSVDLDGKIDVIDLSTLDPEKVKRYRIIDNKSGERAMWDYDLLIPELREIEGLDTLQIYFHDLDLSKSIAPPTYSDMGADSDEDVDDAMSDIQEKFGDNAEKQATALREIICPGCAKVFYVEKREFAKD
jgi:ParB-like chromosome segregation protein Spo0J